MVVNIQYFKQGCETQPNGFCLMFIMVVNELCCVCCCIPPSCVAPVLMCWFLLLTCFHAGLPSSQASTIPRVLHLSLGHHTLTWIWTLDCFAFQIRFGCYVELLSVLVLHYSPGIHRSWPLHVQHFQPGWCKFPFWWITQDVIVSFICF